MTMHVLLDSNCQLMEKHLMYGDSAEPDGLDPQMRQNVKLMAQEGPGSAPAWGMHVTTH